MLRTKITMTYAVLIIVLTVSSVLLMRMDVGSKLESGLNTQVGQGVNTAVGELRLRQASLMARAEFAASSQGLHAAMAGEGAEAKEDEGEGEDGKKEPSFEEKRHLIVHEKLTAEQYKLDDVRKSGQLAGARAGRPATTEIFMALDGKGVGVAALGKDLFSWFGDDVSADHPGVSEVLKTGLPRVEYWTWAFGKNEPGLYHVAIAPIRSGSDKPIGVVVVGEPLSDTVAHTARALAAGLPEDTKAKDERLEGAPHVLISYGEEYAGSTFDSNQVADLSGAFKPAQSISEEGLVPFQVGDTSYVGVGADVGADGDKAVRVIVVGNQSNTVGILDTMSVNFILLGVVFLLLGIGIMLGLILTFVRPLEALEGGMQEVIAGNRDYQWTGDGHSLQQSFAHSLNLMSAFLQGKRMPDEDEEGGSWGATMDLGENTGGAPPKVAGVDFGMMQSLPPKPEDEQ